MHYWNRLNKALRKKQIFNLHNFRDIIIADVKHHTVTSVNFWGREIKMQICQLQAWILALAKKSSYVQWMLYHSRHSCHLKTQKHSLSIGLYCSGFSFYEDFRQFTYAVFFIFITIRCAWVKRFYTKPILYFSALLETASLLFCK